MSQRPKKDRSQPPQAPGPPPPLPMPSVSVEELHASAELKVGETFIVLRRAPSKHGITDERCLATVVEIRDGVQARASPAAAAAAAALAPSTAQEHTITAFGALFMACQETWLLLKWTIPG
ncbi:unnamed protein product [Gongylonema pulchrum]|uniref:Uma2 domain-containing protein n=1 Tax=Gongylonema pulchrum TaxID=637853 RepID=A0A183EST5_9BILA|nr:unnamed protein product [Gongylonema pulchrum]